MNGTHLTLTLAVALAAASFTRHGSAARGCPPDALIFYHGAHRWDGPPSVVEHRKGHAEHGPGIYLTTNWETANKYAKGGGSVYRIGLDPSIRFAQDVQIRVADAQAFVKSLSRLRGKADILASLDRAEVQRGPMMPADYLVNTFVNQGAASGQGGPPLAAFLVQHGVDASLVSHSADEDWVVVFNPDKVCMVERLASGQVSRQGFAFSLPKVSRSRSSGGSANRATLTPGLRQVSGETFYWSTDRLVSPGFEVPQAVPRDTPVEDVFERVRQRTAPQAPSRLRCVYVCPKPGRGFCSGRRHEHVYKVKVWGKVFTTDGGLWTEAVFRPAHAEGFAEGYWSPRGDVMINHAEETLVEGRVVVVSKVRVLE